MNIVAGRPPSISAMRGSSTDGCSHRLDIPSTSRLLRRTKWSVIASDPNEHLDEISRYIRRDDEIEVAEEGVAEELGLVPSLP
jgi:hypothetical protein